MSGILVLTHGDLAKVLLETAERILGESDPAVVPMCLDWDQGSAAATEGLKKAIKKLQDKHGSVLVLTDLFGGTPTNLAMTF
ncbi:MAG: PTS sugar transporter subunit IIA, partial [Acidobacteriota bacterium]